MQQQPEVLFKTIPAKSGQIGIILLNRPQALNALSGEMILSMSDTLHKWEKDPEIAIVIIQSSGGRAFCAGGDLKVFYNLGPENYAEGIHFYQSEYQLNLLIHNYPKPYIALLDGIAMGGGLGISIHGTRVIASEKLQLAMPETAIGLYPDVGAGYFLARCPHKIGMYLGLTGNSIGVADALFAKLINAFVPSNDLAKIIDDLAAQDFSKDLLTTIDAVIARHKQDPGPNTLQQYASIIEECFSKDSVEAIFNALAQNNSEWAQKQLSILKTRSPTSLKVAFKELTMSANMNLRECLEQEFALTLCILQEHDLYEGVRAVLIDKTRDPKWQPATLQEVSDAHIEQLFEKKCRL